MSNKSWDKLSTMVSEVLSSLDKKSSETIMSAWNAKKKEVSKLLGNNVSKRVKDPNAPKKPSTSYIIFCGEHREKVRSENPNMSAVEVTSKLGDMWNKCKDRKKYDDAAEQDKKRYQQELANYVPSTEQTSTKKERTGPKRPLTSYMYFCQENRDRVKTENPNMNAKEITTELGARWKRLSDTDKVPYEAMQVADKARYESEKVTENTKETKTKESATKESTTKDATKESTTKETKSKTKESTTKRTSKTKESAGYQYFLNEQKDELESEHPEWNTRKVATELSKRWKQLTNEERDDYENAAAEEVDEVELEDE